jgi:ankyrin repeat protein
MVLDKGADINSLDNYDWTPLFSAVVYSRKEVVEILLRKDADITVQDPGSRTATGIAEEYGYTEIVELLSNQANQLDPKQEIMTICDYAAIGDTVK